MYVAISIFSAALITYLIRFLPFVFLKGEIKSRFVRSFLYYVPYSVLTAMTFPAVFYSVGNVYIGIVATIVAAVMAFFGKSLVSIAAAATAVSYVLILIVGLF